MTDSVAIGLDTFGDITAGADGSLHSAAHVLRDVVAERRCSPTRSACTPSASANITGATSPISAPEVVLGAIAIRTSRILLGSAVTVLSTDDPVRVFQRFSTVDALSNGRAEVILGRGSFTESYPLFGFDLARYEELFEDRLRLFAELRNPGP